MKSGEGDLYAFQPKTAAERKELLSCIKRDAQAYLEISVTEEDRQIL